MQRRGALALASTAVLLGIGLFSAARGETGRSDEHDNTTSGGTTTTIGPQIAPTTRPVSVGSVGFLGEPSGLRVIDAKSELPLGTLWAADTNYLRINADDLVLDGVFIVGGIDFYGTGTLTIRNSIIEGGHGSWQTVMLRHAGSRLELSDSTLRWNPDTTQKAGSGPASIQIAGSHSMSVVRNDISGMPDGIQAAGSDIVIIDNWIHDLAVLGIGEDATHNDGIQLYEGSSEVEIRGNRIEIGAVEGHSNGALFIAGGSTGTISDNYLDGGGYSLRITDGAWSVTSNVFGPTHLFREGAVENVDLIRWADNIDANEQSVEP